MCQNSVEDIKRAHANIAGDERAYNRVNQLCDENETMTLGDAIVQAEKEMFDLFIKELEEFKATGAHYDETLRAEFPIFKGHAPDGHPYPEAWAKGAKAFKGKGHKLGEATSSASALKLNSMD